MVVQDIKTLPKLLLSGAGSVRTKTGNIPDPCNLPEGKALLKAIESTSNKDLTTHQDIFTNANIFFNKAKEIILPLDGQATKFIEQSAVMFSRRNQFHNEHFKLAKNMLEHAHGMEDKLIGVKLMVKSIHMARLEAHHDTMVDYGKETANTALKLAATTKDEAVFKKFLDLSFEAAGIISIDGIRYGARKFYKPFSEAAEEVIRAGPMNEALKEKYIKSARRYASYEYK